MYAKDSSLVTIKIGRSLFENAILGGKMEWWTKTVPWQLGLLGRKGSVPTSNSIK